MQASAAGAKTAAPAGERPAQPFVFSRTPAWRQPARLEQADAEVAWPRDVEPEEVEPGEVEPGDVEPGEVGPGDVGPGEVGPGEVKQSWAAAGRGFDEWLWQAAEEGALGDGGDALEERPAAGTAEEDAKAAESAGAAPQAAGGGLSWEAAIRMIVGPSPHWSVPESAGGGEASAGDASAAPLPAGAATGGAKAMPATSLAALPWAAVEQAMPAGGKASGEANPHGGMAAAGEMEGETGTAAQGTASGAAASFEAEANFDEGQGGGIEGHRQGAAAVSAAGRPEVREEDGRKAGRAARSREDGSALEAGSTVGNAAAEREHAVRQAGVAAPATAPTAGMSAAGAREDPAAAGKAEAAAQPARLAGPAHRAAAQPTQAAGAMAAAKQPDSPDDGEGEGGREGHRGEPAPLEREQRATRGSEPAGRESAGHAAAGRDTEASPMAAGHTAMARSMEAGRTAVAAHSEGSFVQEHRRAEAHGGEGVAGAERLPVREITPVSTPLAPRTVQIQVLGERGEDVQATISATAGGGVQVRLRAAGAALSQAIEQGAPVLRERLEQVHTPRAAEAWDAAAWSAEAGAGVRAAAEGAGQMSAGQENAGQENAGRDDGSPGEGERGGRYSGGERRERHADADGEEFEAYFQAGGRR